MLENVNSSRWQVFTPWIELALAVNLLDLTTSIPNAYNNAPGQRGDVAMAVQLLFGIAGLFVIVRRAPAWGRWIVKIPIPHTAKMALGALLLIQLVHVVFKLERYPFTNVGMFTFQVKAWENPVPMPYLYAWPGNDTWEVFSIRRTGDLFFHDDFFTDHQLCLAYFKYRHLNEVHDILSRKLAENGRPSPLVFNALVRFGADGYEFVEPVPQKQLSSRLNR
jgi:hypothetical protein